ncbi:unnamed protein product [Parnassius mnemosyne]|uniref:Reverse transcriptase domain-containing protein n=1 Tax=Parnassius mnemosyne TaxID=213953 RepID=A0AAV1KIK9_9NEOP
MNLRQLVSEPTHYTSYTETLIDLVCTNAPVRDVTVNNIIGSNGHAMVNVTLSLKKVIIPTRTFSFRPINKINLNAFNNDLYAINWDDVTELPSVDMMVEKFNSMILSLFDKHAAVKTVTLKNNYSLPWVTDVCKMMIDERNMAHDVYRKSGSDEHKKYYKELKSLVLKSISQEKRAYFNSLVNSQAKNSKTFWKNLKEKILVDPSKDKSLPPHFNDPNKINDHFLNIPGDNVVSNADMLFFEHNKFNTEVFKLAPVGATDISKYIMSIKSNAVGHDGINRDMILLSLPCTLDAITAIINKSIVTGIVPNKWKEALVTPIPKNENPVELKDLRPISILPFLAKLLEKAICEQLTKFVEATNILPQLQSGFRKGCGTATALVDVTDNILAEQDSGHSTILTLLDYSRAFDCLNIPLLLAKLSYYGLDKNSVKWFSSYLINRCQSVKLVKSDGSTIRSHPRLVNRGVPRVPYLVHFFL